MRPPFWHVPLVGGHIGQIIQLLIQHLRNHGHGVILELTQESRGLVVRHERFARWIGVDKYSERDIKADAVVLLEKLFSYGWVPYDEQGSL